MGVAEGRGLGLGRRFPEAARKEVQARGVRDAIDEAGELPWKTLLAFFAGGAGTETKRHILTLDENRFYPS